MTMTPIVAIPKEMMPGENRVAATPDTVAKMVKAGMQVLVENGAGNGSALADEDYQKAGASLSSDHAKLLHQANIILKVQRPLVDEVKMMQEKSALIAPLYLQSDPELLSQIRAKHLTAFALEQMPRIARAQAMDILSSMSNLAGYKSVVLAADHLKKIFPMLTTAAGTIQPAKIIIIGAGVAGLQAIATARRLGGVVIAFDTRPPVAEQVKSLGAEFVSLETTHEASEDAGGYAKEQSAAFYQHEQDIISPYSKTADVIITTALIPGKRAPLLITEQMVKAMKPGAVIVDLAISNAGNCALTEADKIVVKHGVTIIGLSNLPSLMAATASPLYAKNVLTFLNYIVRPLMENNLDLTDDIIKNCIVT